MKNKLTILLILFSFHLFGQEIYDDPIVLECIESINVRADSLQKIGEIIKSSQLKNSIGVCIKGLSLEQLQFESVKAEHISLKEINTPVLLIISASWCESCMFEIPAINKIAEEYDEKIKVLVLFWDDKKFVEKMLDKFSPKVALIPSPNRSRKDNRKGEIAGFKHYLTYPTIYFLNQSKEITYLSSGAMVERKATELREAITKEEANQTNYEKIKSFVEQLIKD